MKCFERYGDSNEQHTDKQSYLSLLTALTLVISLFVFQGWTSLFFQRLKRRELPCTPSMMSLGAHLDIKLRLLPAGTHH